MSDLSLAKNHALDLARTLMVPVTLFEIDGEIGSCLPPSMTATRTPSSMNTIHSLTDRLIEPITHSGEGVPLALLRAQGRLRRELSRQICTLRTAPLRASIFAAWAPTVRIVRKAKGSDMEKSDIEELRARVGCAAVLEYEGFAIDRKESTRRAVKFRRKGSSLAVERSLFCPNSFGTIKRAAQNNEASQ